MVFGRPARMPIEIELGVFVHYILETIGKIFITIIRVLQVDESYSMNICRKLSRVENVINTILYHFGLKRRDV